MDFNSNRCDSLCPSLSYDGNSDREVLFKVLIIGDVGVGKSSVLQRFVDNTFKDKYGATIGVDFKTTNVNLRDKLVKLQIWDTAGHERFRTMTSAFYRGAHGAVVVYDVTNVNTFTNIPQWLKDLDIYGCNHIVKTLFGNKCDATSSRAVSRETAFKYADSENMSLFETSAKTGEQIYEAFLDLVSRMLDCFDDGASARSYYTADLSTCLLSAAEEVEHMMKPCSC